MLLIPILIAIVLFVLIVVISNIKIVPQRGDLGVDDITGSQGAVQLHLADDVAQGGCGQVFDRRHRALDTTDWHQAVGTLRELLL